MRVLEVSKGYGFIVGFCNRFKTVEIQSSSFAVNEHVCRSNLANYRDFSFNITEDFQIPVTFKITDVYTFGTWSRFHLSEITFRYNPTFLLDSDSEES